MLATLIFPHQLFKDHPALEKGRPVYLMEHPLFFGDKVYPANFHKKKLIFHRASMKSYQKFLENEGYKVHYLDYGKHLPKDLKFIVCDVCDFILEKRLRERGNVEFITSPQFLTSTQTIQKSFHADSMRMATFYISQRKRLNILVEKGKPKGGKWSFDTENRKKLPANAVLPTIAFPKKTPELEEAIKYVDKHFPDNPGDVEEFWYPITHKEAETWLDSFIQERFEKFGEYEDAIKKDGTILFHSLLSPLLNAGLLTPSQVIQKVLKANVPLNSMEGFIRQIIGWREFIRAVYIRQGVEERNSNFWKHTRKMPKAFYNGTTGIDPVDDVIARVKKYAWCHHIERLMVLGSFMLLCEIDPNDIYLWFMELFIDSYDWVMVPNVYGMSQYAEGGLITTKPYLCSSNYIRKMSDFKEGPWCEIWDALFWRFFHKHRLFFASNPRLSMLVLQLDKMDPKKLEQHLKTAENFLKDL